MHAFTYQIYELKIKSKINFRLKVIIYISHVSKKKNQILKLFSKYVCQFHTYETRGSDITVEILCRDKHVYFNFFKII